MIRLPDPTRTKEADAAGVDPAEMRRLIGDLTLILNRFAKQVEEAQRRAYIETDLARPPTRVGAVAIVGPNIYIAVGLSPANWTQVN